LAASCLLDPRASSRFKKKNTTSTPGARRPLF
jgi:hypothetical protein